MSIVRILHTSDLHIGADPADASGRTSPAYSLLGRVLEVGRIRNIDVLVIAGDLFDSPRVGEEEIRKVAMMLQAFGLPTVVLPGNHDCLVPDSAYSRHSFSAMAPNVSLIADPRGESLTFPGLDLAIWGRPHTDYSDFSPMGSIPRRGQEKWQLAVAHGLFVQDGVHEGRGWKITQDELADSERDYVALGHLEMFNRVGTNGIATYYSGSPKQTGAVVLVELGGTIPVDVSQVPLTANHS